MIILAHRGWWKTADEKNSRGAFERALRAGYGIETDIRDRAGELVISHDPPGPGPLMTLSEFACLCVDIDANLPLALNIKSDGLQQGVAHCIAAHSLSSSFVFDMAVPDALGYLRRGVRTFTRHSTYEPVAAFYAEAAGVWVDCFDGQLLANETVAEHAAAGKGVALVSPELHGKPHQRAWMQWKSLPASATMLCTDFPDEADTFFNG